MATAIKRTYSNFKGVDFANESSMVDISRSPDALNVWKNYSSTQGTCIETRPGYRYIDNFEGKPNGLFIYKNIAILFSSMDQKWTSFPIAVVVRQTKFLR